MKESTLVIIKPDAYSRGLAGYIITFFEKVDLKIIHLKVKTLDPCDVDALYAEHMEKDHYPDLRDMMITGSSIIMEVYGEDAVQLVSDLVGSIDTPGTIRGDFATDIRHNCVHRSDSKEAAYRELSYFRGYFTGWKQQPECHNTNTLKTIVVECDLGHKFAKLSDHPMRDNQPRCPHCMAIGLDKTRKANDTQL